MPVHRCRFVTQLHLSAYPSKKLDVVPVICTASSMICSGGRLTHSVNHRAAFCQRGCCKVTCHWFHNMDEVMKTLSALTMKYIDHFIFIFFQSCNESKAAFYGIWFGIQLMLSGLSWRSIGQGRNYVFLAYGRFCRDPHALRTTVQLDNSLNKITLERLSVSLNYVSLTYFRFQGICPIYYTSPHLVIFAITGIILFAYRQCHSFCEVIPFISCH